MLKIAGAGLLKAFAAGPNEQGKFTILNDTYQWIDFDGVNYFIHTQLILWIANANMK